ncbi:MAG: SDR family oxidoreductase [Paludibacter sp.]|nr:SDR family oxidoreductase [Paludibacter sp.]
MILVTGATGLVGGNLIWHLLQENDRVAAIRRPTSDPEPLRVIFSFYTANPDDYLSRIDWRIADVLDEHSIHQAMEGILVVYHCAAVVSFDKSTSSILDVNVTGTRNIIRAALENRIDKLCFVSSIAACGRAFKNELIIEDSLYADSTSRSLYSQSKYLSEQEVWKGIQKGLNAVIVNPGVILGVSGSNSGSSQLFNQVQKGLMFYTHGGSGYVDVQDVVKVMILLTNSNISSERFILVSENCSNKDILCWMADGFGKRRPIISIGRQTFWVVGLLSEIIGKAFHFRPLIDRSTARTATHREYYSSLKVEKALGFKFVPIEKSIREICHFMLKK